MNSIRDAISKIDWETYQLNVLKTLKLAIFRFNTEYLHSNDKKVYQIAIWTDPQAFTTCISFETKSHAADNIKRSAKYWRSRNDINTAEAIEELGYCTNPADFEFRQYECFDHSELNSVVGVAYEQQSQRHLIETYLETNLVAVLQQILDEGVLKSLHAESEVIIGVNSPSDWYDHIHIIQFSI